MQGNLILTQIKYEPSSTNNSTRGCNVSYKTISKKQLRNMQLNKNMTQDTINTILTGFVEK